MKKDNSFFEMLLSRAEMAGRIENKRIVYFDAKGHRAEEDGAKWWVCNGVVYDNEEKISSKVAKYSHNLGFLY